MVGERWKPGHTFTGCDERQGMPELSAVGYIRHHVLPMESPELRRRCLRVVLRMNSKSDGDWVKLNEGGTLLQAIILMDYCSMVRNVAEDKYLNEA